MFRWITGLRGGSASSTGTHSDSGDSIASAMDATLPSVNEALASESPAVIDVPVVENDDNKPPVSPPASITKSGTDVSEVKSTYCTDDESNSAEQDAIARALLRQAPIEDLSELFKNSTSVRAHPPPTVMPQVEQPRSPLVRPAFQESGMIHRMQMAFVRRETAVLRFRELWDILPHDLPARHPLNSRWVLWYLKNDRTKNWEDCLHKVTTFDSIEGFWSAINHIIPPSELPWGSDFYVFREGILPMWEDENNVKGGRWLVYVERARRAQDLDHYWMELLMALVGEQFGEDGASISGAVVNIRQKGDKVALWTKDAEKDGTNYRIGHVCYDVLRMQDPNVMRYEVHKDASARTGSCVKPRIVLPAKYMKTLTPQQNRELRIATGEVQAPALIRKYLKHTDINPGGNFSFENFLNHAREIQAELH
uniref:eIF-4F 25 kDa subunit n=1 Tax=Panagrellus redivivus TaxID=6233 RepID=A0A7E4VSX0_PANRE